MNFLSADDMSAILAVKLRKRLGFGMWAKLHITGMHVEGKVWHWNFDFTVTYLLNNNFFSCYLLNTSSWIQAWIQGYACAKISGQFLVKCSLIVRNDLLYWRGVDNGVLSEMKWFCTLLVNFKIILFKEKGYIIFLIEKMILFLFSTF